MGFRLVISPSSADRLSATREVVRSCAPGTRILIVGATRGAADDLARRIAIDAAATFGIQRLSLTQLAARAALSALAAEGFTSSTRLGAEAVATRAAFDATQDASLRYFAPVAGTPGFPRALAHTLQELRLAGLSAGALAPLPLAGPDLAVLLDRFDACFAQSGSVDHAALFRTAAAAVRTDTAGADVIVLLDLPLDHAAEREFVAAVIASASTALATAVPGDRKTVAHFEQMGGVAEGAVGSDDDDLSCLRTFLFNTEVPPRTRELDGSLQVFSAPGEGRECVEMVRRVVAEARRGVRLDEMAILVRAPHSYLGLIEHALRRADVPAWFDRGTRRPHPAGRAFLALLACAAERLSAGRFAEYLSLGQVPAVSSEEPAPAVVADGTGSRRAAVRNPPYIPSSDEAFALPEEANGGERGAGSEDPESESGALRAPWQWEKFLVDAAVIGQDASRWRRRLAGKSAELAAQAREAQRQEGPDSSRAEGLRRLGDQLAALQHFALPIIEELAAWPRQAVWGEWLDLFTRLAPRVLRSPAPVLRVLADLRPMAGVGPIDLDEGRRVLSERLLTLESEPPARRFGRIFVGTPAQARGRSFRVVFVPGLAERMFPQKPREDPLLLDALRGQADESLATQPQRLAAERLLLQIAAGAASERLYISYPRIELAESRARVPSFYALDVIRAATGRVPDYEWLEARARVAGNATLAWPAPPDPREAIDDQEHDLAVLRQLLDDHDRDRVKGHAHYLLKLNECLRRSVIDRWARGEPRWSANDGLTRIAPDTGRLLAAQRLTARPYSLSALQRFSACPYQFVLAAVYRLQPMEQPEPLQRLDPLTRGSLFHEIQARFFGVMNSRASLPVTAETLATAHAVLDDVADVIAKQKYDELAPAVDRVWHDEIAAVRRDLHAWLYYLARDGAEWRPRYFEFGFGSVPGDRDANSVLDEVTLPGGYKLRGAVDLIEEHRATDVLRVTDHKTGRKPDRIDKVIVGGGAVLQPVLYAMAIEAALGRSVSQGRLFYCTASGSFYEHPIPLNEMTREAGLEVLQVIDRAIETGFLAATPTEDACGRCDYRAVCGPDVFRRVRRKPQDRIADLAAIRRRP